MLLTGYAGEINLAVLSFGAIGAIVVHHFGVVGQRRRRPHHAVGLRAGGRACVPWSGRWWRCPSLRLRGLYLALSTMAFGVFVSNMVLREITERKLPLAPHRVQHLPQRQPHRAPAQDRAARPGGHAARSSWP